MRPARPILNLLHLTLICIGYLACLYLSVYLLFDGVVAMVVVAVAAGLLVVSPRVSVTAVLRRHSANLVAFDSAPQIGQMLEQLSRKAGLRRSPALYRIPFESQNIFAAGRPDDSVIAISDGVLKILSFREIAAVFAHELGHIIHRDTQVTGLTELLRRSFKSVRSLVYLVVPINAIAWLSGTEMLAWEGLALLFIGMVLLLFWTDLPLHKREFDADAAAVALTQDPEALISALQKIEGALTEEGAEDSLSDEKQASANLRLKSHPQIEQRLTRLLSLSSSGQYMNDKAGNARELVDSGSLDR